ncbi:MAG: hypothetical protein IPJ92_08565 [Veillonella sp.]|nr:hypothetical protein [Veillonella sp.]
MAKHSIQYWLRVTMISIMAILLLMGTKTVALPFVVSFVLTLILLPLVNIMQDTLQNALASLGYTIYSHFTSIFTSGVATLFSDDSSINTIFN